MATKPRSNSLRTAEFEQQFSDEFLLTVEQAALYLAVSLSTLNHWRSGGKGPSFVKLCGSARGAIRYRMGDIRQWVAKNTFTSVADADYANAQRRVSDQWTAWGTPHPFVVKSSFFVVDSAHADAATFQNVFFDPFVKLRWMPPEKALLKPWLRPLRRIELLNLFLNSPSGAGAAALIQTAYRQALARVPESAFAAHPDLTLKTLFDSVGQAPYPVEYVNH